MASRPTVSIVKHSGCCSASFWEVSFEAFNTLRSGTVTTLDSGGLNFTGEDVTGERYYSQLLIPVDAARRMNISEKGIKGRNYIIHISGADPTPYTSN